jgi:hypothetical protein
VTKRKYTIIPAEIVARSSKIEKHRSGIQAPVSESVEDGECQ